MAKLSPRQISTESLSVNYVLKTMTGEASTMRFQPERLYDDACDVGIALRSHRTGEVSTWYLEDTVVDEKENELLYWVLCPTAETVRMHPQLKDFKLTVFND